MLGLYVCKVCGTISSLCRWGKIKAMKFLANDIKYIELFCNIRKSAGFAKQTFTYLESFVTCMIRYVMISCAKRKKFQSELFLPWRVSLLVFIRVRYGGSFKWIIHKFYFLIVIVRLSMKTGFVSTGWISSLIKEILKKI